MTARHLVVVHNNIDGRSAIGAIASWAVREGIARGWRVTAVCRDLESDLVHGVDRRPLYVPPRLHLLQWAAARQTIRRAMHGLSYDALLVYQPQVAALADVWHVEYLSREARNLRAPLEPGLKNRIHDIEAAGIATLEDAYLRRLPTSTRVLFCSDGLKAAYDRLYGPHPNAGVLYNPALLAPAPSDMRLPNADLRSRYVGTHSGPVLGFLGGNDPRKGGDLILDAMATDPSLFLVHAGPSPLDTSGRNMQGRSHGLGHLSDVRQLLDAIDVLMVPSRFEPFGLVVTEAVARGVPVVVTPTVGAAPLVVEAGVAKVWRPGTPLRPLVDDLMRARAGMSRAAASVCDVLRPDVIADQLFSELDAVVERKRASRL